MLNCLGNIIKLTDNRSDIYSVITKNQLTSSLAGSSCGTIMQRYPAHEVAQVWGSVFLLTASVLCNSLYKCFKKLLPFVERRQSKLQLVLTKVLGEAVITWSSQDNPRSYFIYMKSELQLSIKSSFTKIVRKFTKIFQRFKSL